MVDNLSRPMSRLLFLSAELFEEGQIDKEQSTKLKQQVFFKDKNLYNAVKHISDINDLKNQMREYSIRLVAQERAKTGDEDFNYGELLGQASDNEE